MLSNQYARFALGMIAAITVLSQTGCATAATVPDQPQSKAPNRAQAIALACTNEADNTLAASARRYPMPDSEGTLWFVPCIRGAYQTAYNVVFAPDEGQPRQLLFVHWRDGSWAGTADVFNPAFDPHANILTDQYKDRGVGDCGGARRWQWTAREFRLLEYRAKSDCDGTPPPFPVIFEAPALP